MESETSRIPNSEIFRIMSFIGLFTGIGPCDEHHQRIGNISRSGLDGRISEQSL